MFRNIRSKILNQALTAYQNFECFCYKSSLYQSSRRSQFLFQRKCYLHNCRTGHCFKLKSSQKYRRQVLISQPKLPCLDIFSQFCINVGEIYSDKDDNAFSDNEKNDHDGQISGSSSLYKFGQSVETSNALTPEEWKTLENNILSENPDLHKSWTTLCMMLIHASGNFEQGENLLDYIRHHQGKTPSIPTISTFIALCGKVKGKQKQDLLLKEYNELKKHAELFDSITTKNLIIGFCGTSEWKKSLEFLEMTKLTHDPGPAYYNPIIVAALREKEMDLVDSLLNTLGNKNATPGNVVFETFIDMCARSKGQIDISSLLKYFRKFNWLPNQELACKIEDFFMSSVSEKWKCIWTTVDKSGVCQACKHKLDRIVLTDADFQNLQQEFLSSALIGENVYLKSNPEEVERFKDFVQEHAPFDVVLDALNVTALGSSVMLRKVVEFFATHHNQRVLVIGRKHMEKTLGRNLQPIMRMASVFFTDNISKDDPFTLYAAIYSGKSTVLVSNDYMRDHKCLLKPHLQEIFERWQRSKQISMKKQNYANIILQMPLRYDTGPQEDSKGWHIPYEDFSERAAYEHPNTYLCLRRKSQSKKNKKAT